MTHNCVRDLKHPYFFPKPENEGFGILTVIIALEIIECQEVKGQHDLGVDILRQWAIIDIEESTLESCIIGQPFIDAFLD
jgi:hypothetical protein